MATVKDKALAQNKTARHDYTIVDTIEAGLGVNPLPISDFDGIYEKNLGILTLGALVT